MGKRDKIRLKTFSKYIAMYLPLLILYIPRLRPSISLFLFTEQYEGREKDDETTKGLSSTLY